MATAVRINVVDDELTVEQTVNFDQNEVADADIKEKQSSIKQKSQTGKPSIALLSDPYDEVMVNFRIHGSSTTDKMATIRTALQSGKMLQVFPIFQDEPWTNRNCIASPEDFLVKSLFSGHHRGGQRVRVNFSEREKPSYARVGEWVHFDFKAIAQYKTGTGNNYGWGPTAPAKWVHDTANTSDDTKSFEWTYGSGYGGDELWSATTAPFGLQYGSFSHNSPPQMRYDTSVQRALSNLLWPNEDCAIYEFWVHDAHPNVAPSDAGAFFAAPWTASAADMYFQMEQDGDLTAWFDDSVLGQTLTTSGTDYRNTNHQFAVVFYPSSGSSDGFIKIYVDAVEIASVSHNITDMDGHSVDNRFHLGMRNGGTQQFTLQGTQEIFNYTRLTTAQYSDITAAEILKWNYEYFKNRVFGL